MVNYRRSRPPEEKSVLRSYTWIDLVALKGEHVAVKEMRKHMAWYLKGMTGSARIKDAIMEMLKRDEMVEL